MKTTAYALATLLLTFIFSACSDIDNIRNFANCEFALLEIIDPTVANVSFSDVNSIDDISNSDWLAIQSAYREGSLPVSVIVKIQVTNNGEGAARLQRLMWQLSLEQQRLAEGEISDPVNIPGGQSIVVPFFVRMDIVDFIENGSFDEIRSLVKNFLDAGYFSSTVSIGIKPTILVAGREFTPGQFIIITRRLASS